jgi:threonylcarbamoyladenosine tRNA methylthiotransferase MtaB
MISFSIQNFGCRVNQAEAFSWAEEFQDRGLRLEEDLSRSQVIVVNTCTLTGRADRDVRKFIRRVAQLNPGARVVVTGCSVERSRREFADNPLVWRVFSNTEKKDLPAEVIALVGEEGEARILPFRSRALLKIQDGCNCRCAFCVIPSVRGRSESSPQEEILDRLRRFISRGFREIVLAGIHLSSYGLDLQPRSSLLGLLREVEKLEGLGRVRMSSLDPRFMDENLMGFLAGSPKVCPHFHLSLQHGSDRILALMGRKSTTREYAWILDSLRRGSRDAALGADIMVGFPEETEEDFRETYRFLNASPLDYFHVFSYSPRPGTEAASRKPVDAKEAKERSAVLRKLSKEKQTAFRRRFIGRELDGIVIDNEDGRTEVLTPNYIPAWADGPPPPEGSEVRVKITGVSASAVSGDIMTFPHGGRP